MSFELSFKLKSPAQIIKSHGLDDDGFVTKFLRDEVDRFCDPYIPMDVGILKNTKTYPNNHTIKYTSPYAHYMYKGQLMLSPTGSAYARKGEKKHYVGKSLKYQGAPKRGAEWDKRMMNDRRNDVVRDLQNFINDGGK